MYINTNLCQGIIRNYFPDVQRGVTAPEHVSLFLRFFARHGIISPMMQKEAFI